MNKKFNWCPISLNMIFLCILLENSTWKKQKETFNLTKYDLMLCFGSLDEQYVLKREFYLYH